MDKVQKPVNPDRHTPSSEPFRIYMHTCVQSVLVHIRYFLEQLFTDMPKAATHAPVFCTICMPRPKSEAKTEHWEGPHTIQSFWLFSAQSSVIENISDDMVYVSVAIVCKKKVWRRQLTRSKWTKDWLLKRNVLFHTDLLSELRLDPGDWFSYLRTDVATYLELLQKIIPLIEKSDTVMEEQSIHTKDSALHFGS
jgi:hypothetical protein